ncbi:MAG: LPS export ABC transporter periplasmic protein LptC [Cytophagaceae bacterium]|nr:LPS export ABC transporter periplasmic protein LptC [Cytophagaceae bacterium]
MKKSVFQTIGKRWLPLCFSGILLLFGCKEENLNADVEYTGPTSETNDVVMLYSDSARLAVKMMTPRRLEQANGDHIFPQEVKLFFYDRSGRQTSTLRSDSGRFYPSRNLFIVKGHVVVTRKKEKDTLLTDELTWSKDSKKFYTDKAVIWRTAFNELHGVGFAAEQDMSGYVLRKPTGTLPMSNLP